VLFFLLSHSHSHLYFHFSSHLSPTYQGILQGFSVWHNIPMLINRAARPRSNKELNQKKEEEEKRARHVVEQPIWLAKEQEAARPCS
jgi:hypothetical protein